MSDLYTKIKNIPAPIASFFLSEEPRILCEQAVFMYNLSDGYIPAVTKPLGAIFVKDLALEQYPEEIYAETDLSDGQVIGIASEVCRRIFIKFPEYFTDAEALLKEWESKREQPKLSPEAATKKVFELEPWLLEKDVEEQENEEIKEKTLKRLQILQALSEYSNLGNQNITTERIRIKSQPEPVRGSLYNWIKCYRDELGIGQHSTVERGQFLFRSENGKRLSPEERERINLILKSIEENYALDIDPEKQIIVFPEMHFEKALAGAPTGNVASLEIKDSFSKDNLGTNAEEQVTKPPTPKAFFAPRPETTSPAVPQVVVDKFQSGNASVEKSAINSILAERQQPVMSGDFTHAAEKLKREPKPEWIKGAFTKESIPEKVQPEPVTGTMSFSLNHVLPVEQETDKKTNIEKIDKPSPKAPSKELEPVGIKAKQGVSQSSVKRNQFHIRPVNRRDF